MAYSNPKPSKSHTKEKRNRSHLCQHESNIDEQQQQQQQEGSPVPKKSKPSSAWANLDLILSLQRNDLEDQRKIELVFEFVNSHVDLGNDPRPHPVSVSRLASFLSDWIQPLLIAKKKSSDLLENSLDYRCWLVLRFCLKNSLVTVSLNILKSVTHVLKSAGDSNDGKLLLDSVLECFELILSINSRAFYNASMDVWKPCVVEITGAVRKSTANDGPGLSDDVLSRLSCLLLEHFVNFLRFHKDPTNIFIKFVDGLLEPLLELLVLLRLRIKDRKCGQAGGLLRLVEDVLSNGLFHPANIGGFFILRSSNTEQQTWAPKGHKEFFKKLGNIIKEKKAMALWGFGYLFRLFITSANTQKGASLAFKSNQSLAKTSEASDEHEETSKPMFEVFVQFMQPLLLECKRCSEMDFSEFGEVSEDRMLETHGMLKSVNETLLSFIQGKIYIRTEDTSEGAHYNFLKEVYDTIVSISMKIYQLWLSKMDMDDDRVKMMLTLVAREVVAAIGYFSEIEYKVVEDDLVKLWLIMFSFLAVHISSEDKKPSSSLISDILNLGCKLINIYSELRQVNSPLFALCKAVKLLKNDVDSDVVDYSVLVCSLSSNVYLKSVGTLLCSQELQAAISNAIKSIPEGQACRCVQLLKEDVADTLQWIRTNPLRDDGENLTETDKLNVGTTCLDTQAEIFGRFLSEIYTTVLDSLTVTATNSVSIGNSIKSLMGTVGPGFSNLVKSQSGSVDDFIFSVTGRRFCDHEKSEIDSGTWTRTLSISWVLVFFFRMYISCRSLYRQLISLMPPVQSAKAAKTMGSFLTVACEGDWKDRPESMDEGYFSWIVKPSVSLLDLTMSHLEDFLSSTGCSPLLYVMFIMALQRLSDLNRLIKAFEFLRGRDINKSREEYERLIVSWKQEATELTNFMIRRGKFLDCEALCISVKNDEVGDTEPAYDDTWDLGVCSLNERSLRIAIWRLFCQNVDVWCAHAAKKYIKKFLSCLFWYSVQDMKRYEDVNMQSANEPFSPKVTMHCISMEFLSNIVSYEQSTLCRHYTSGFGRVLEKLLAPILSRLCAHNIDLGSLPDWAEFLNMLKKEPLIALDDRITSLLNRSSLPNTTLVRPRIQDVELTERQSYSFSFELRTCGSLLNLLSKIPKVQLDAKSFLVYAAYVMNLERLAVSNLLNNCGDSFVCDPYELLRLFISCRRLMKYLLLASLEDNSGAADSSISAVFESPDSVLWLLSSVSEIVGLSHASFVEKYSNWMQDIICPLVDHTSCIYLAIGEIHMNAIKASLIKDANFRTEHPVEIMAEMLKEQARNLLVSLGPLHEFELKDRVRVLSCSRLAVTLSCFQGFLWGLISAIDHNEDASTINPRFSRLMSAHLTKLIECITLYENILNLCFNMDERAVSGCTSHNLLDLLAYELSCTEFEHYSVNKPRREQAVRVYDSTFNQYNNEKNLSECDNNSGPACEKPIVSSSDAVGVFNVLNTVCKTDLSKLGNWKGSLLQSLLKGECPEMTFTLRQLFSASAAILKLKSILWFPRPMRRHSNLAESSMHVLLETSVLILRETAEVVGKLDPSSFVWLDGVLTFLEVVGSSNIDLKLLEAFYIQLMDMHLRVIGKCISLQGKSATLSSHETTSSTKMLQSHNISSRNDMQLPDQMKMSINALKSRLRISFRKLISPTKFDLMTALQLLERALIGVHQECNVVSEINTGNVDGGEASSIVAAGIDCLELVLDSLSGNELVRGKILSFMSAMFNIILHLRNPTIFYLEKQRNYECEVKPDSGAVILMCVEILTNMAGNDSVEMEPWHVSQSFLIPLALFSGFRHLKDPFFSYKASTFSYNQEVIEPSRDMHCDIIDHKFSVELYASCCRLLCMTLKHRKCPAEQCISMLEESVGTLLNSLEMVDIDLVRGQCCFSWKKEEAIKCATFLRRVYEEIRNQKDVFAKYSFYFLSNYICTYSGFGPLKTGIKREIDDALRPGVYALIDVCSKADIQQLHISLGEGSRRSTLKTLRHDYDVHFRYGGKI